MRGLLATGLVLFLVVLAFAAIEFVSVNYATQTAAVIFTLIFIALGVAFKKLWDLR